MNNEINFKNTSRRSLTTEDKEEQIQEAQERTEAWDPFAGENQEIESRPSQNSYWSQLVGRTRLTGEGGVFENQGNPEYLRKSRASIASNCERRS